MDRYLTKNKAIQLLPGSAKEGPVAERARRLAQLADAMDTVHAFHKGQFVRWKPGLRNRATPANNEIACVREVLPTPVFDQCEHANCTASPYFGEPLTLVLAVFGDGGEFLEFRYDSRRLEPAEL